MERRSESLDMRLPADVPSKSNSFSSFAYNDSSDNVQDTRLPDKEFMQEIKKLPVIKRTNNKRIVISDDEDDVAEVSHTTSHVSSTANNDSGWLDARNPSDLSEADRERNKKVAMAERKQSKQPAIQKANRLAFKRDDSDEDVVDTPDKTSVSKILAKSRLIAGSLMGSNDQSDEESGLDPVEEVRRFKLKEKLDSRTKRLQSRAGGKDERQAKKQRSGDSVVDLVGDEASAEEAEAADSDSGSSSSDSDGGARWRDDLGKGELQEQANKILRNCDSVSLNLRKSLRAWQTEDDDRAQSGAKDCVDLLRIRVSSASADQVLTDQDVQVQCPGLQLKAYQLVGVNWMKLLHLNSVNGVLADDMGLGTEIVSIVGFD